MYQLYQRQKQQLNVQSSGETEYSGSKKISAQSDSELKQYQQEQSYQFLHLADTHFDSKYVENTNKICDGASCCRLQTNSSNHNNQFKPSGYWGAYNGTCDPPLKTVDKMIQSILEQQSNRLDFIIWTGDSMDHFEQEQTQSNQTSNMKTVYQLIKKYNNSTRIFGIFGNHECFPESQCDLYGQKSQFLLNQTSELFKSELDEQGYQSLKQNGYYYQRIVSKNLKIVVLNTQVCDLTNFYLLQNPSDPNNQLEWLIQQLQDSEDRKEQVFITGHIPPSNEWCDHQWQQRYSIIIERYQDIVKGQFFAHTHNDEISIMRTNNYDVLEKKKPTNIIYIAPSLTTFSQINPSYRVFSVSSVDNQIVDYDQYRLTDLDILNQMKDKAVFKFRKQYSFKQEYQLQKIDLEMLVDRLDINKKSSLSFIIKYLQNYYTGLISYDESVLLNKDKYIKQICTAQYSIFQDQVACEGIIQQLKSPKNMLFIALEYVTGDWFKLSNE